MTLGGIAEAFVGGIKGGVEWIIESLLDIIGTGLEQIFRFVLNTPVSLNNDTPLWAFSAPDSGLWVPLFDTYQTVQHITFALFILVLGTTLTAGTFRNSAETRKTIRRLVVYFPVAYWWWWIGGWFLKFNQVLTDTLIQGSFSTEMGAIVGTLVGGSILLVIVWSASTAALASVAAVYISRWLVIHIYMVAMPILLMLRCIPEDNIQGFANSLISKFPPLVLMTVPTAILLNIGVTVMTYDGGGSLAGMLTGGVMGGVFATIILVIAAILPKYVFQFSGQVQSAVGSATGFASGAAKQTKATVGGSASGSTTQQTLNGGQATGIGSSAAGGTTGSSTASGSATGASGSGDPYMQDPDLDFNSATERRGAKAVSKTISAGKTAKSATETASQKTASGTLTALGGTAKAVEKGKQSDMPTATGTVDAGAKQAWQSASEKASSAASSATDKSAQTLERVKSARENRVDRRLSNARETVTNTIEKSRQETGYTDVFDRDEEPAVSDDYDDSAWDAYETINTAEGEPAMDGTATSTGGASFEQIEAADSSGTPTEPSTNGAGSQPTTSPSTTSARSMVSRGDDDTYTVDERQAEQAAANIAADTDLWQLGREDQDDPIYDELGIDDSPDGDEYPAVQATRHKLYEQADNKGEIPYSDRNKPDSNDYTFEELDGESQPAEPQSAEQPAESAASEEPINTADGEAAMGGGSAPTAADEQPQPTEPTEPSPADQGAPDASENGAWDESQSTDNSDDAGRTETTERSDDTQSTATNGEEPPTQPDTNTTVGNVGANQTYERNSSEESVGSFGNGANQPTESSPDDTADPAGSELSPAEQAVQEYTETQGQSIDEVRPPELAGKIMSDDRIDTPRDAVDAVESLKND